MAALLISLALAAVAGPLQAPVPWVVERTAYRCAIRRQGDSAPPSFEIGSVPGSDTFVLRIGLLPAPHPLPRAFALRLAPDDAAELRYHQSLEAPEVGFVLYNTDRDFPDRLGRARAATILGDGQELAELPIGGIAAGIRALNSCIDESLRRWGVDPRARAALSRQPAPPGGRPANWFRSDDYPASALRAEQTGMVVMRLSVAADGRVEACDVVVSSGYAALDQRSCQVILERARFEPALDAVGRPVAVKAIDRVNWRLER